MTWETVRCQRCDREFQARVCARRMFCSRKCADEARGSGERHYLWKGEQAKPQSARRRAWAAYPTRPCQECGDPNAHRHHIDGDLYNNAPDNIAFLCIVHHNKRHAREGTGVRGESQHLAKLTAERVRVIRLLGRSHTARLAAEYGVQQQTIRQVLSGRTWKHVA